MHVKRKLVLPSLISFCLFKNQSGILYCLGLDIMVIIFSTSSSLNSPARLLKSMSAWNCEDLNVSPNPMWNRETFCTKIGMDNILSLYNKQKDCPNNPCVYFSWGLRRLNHIEFSREKTQGVIEIMKKIRITRIRKSLLCSYLLEDNVGVSSTNTLDGCDGEHNVSFT